MDYQIFRLLEREELETVLSFVNQQAFVDGRATARGLASDVKRNLQIPRSGGELSDADRLLISSLQGNRDFQRFAYPKRITLPMYSRYEPGMTYGTHVDDGIMSSRNGDPVRSDIALTIFLSPAASYDGGELVLELSMGEQEIKLDAGEAVAYSCNALHRVNPVTRGVRLAAITWAQSTVRDVQVRAILTDLSRSIAMAGESGNRDLTLLLNKSYHNLLRYASEP
jgi:PKHD-type hydroxylase